MLPTSASHHRTDITVRASRQEYRIQTEKEALILPWLSGDTIVSIENPKDQKNKGLLEIRTHEVFMPAL